MIHYCTKCLFPETKPDLHMDEQGVCSACRYYESRSEIDWDSRRRELISILDKYRSKDSSNYDCIVPVSGGKDSHYQVIKMLELGMNPLCVTATTCSLSEIGRRNIENIKKLGVDYIEVTTNRVVRRKLNKFALNHVGDISWPEHVSIFTAPVRIAVKFNIPLIIWGENSQHEYGGPATAAEDRVLNRRWLEEFGGLLGLQVADLVGHEGIKAHDLIQFTYPSDEELHEVGVTGLFLGYFLPWDGFQNVLIAQSRGFESYPHCIEGSSANYENLDNYQVGIHDYFKFIKYGYSRTTDISNIHIRRGRMTRADALEIVKLHDGKFPWSYLGKPLEQILADIDMTLDEFTQACTRYTNKKLFVCDQKGALVKDKNGNLSKINYDNP